MISLRRSRLSLILFFLLVTCIANSGLSGELSNQHWNDYGGWGGTHRNALPGNAGSSIVTDITTPDQTSVLQFFYPAGFRDGGEPSLVGGWLGPVTEFYMRYYFKYSENWQWHPISDKITYIKTYPSMSVAGGGSETVLIFQNGPSGTLGGQLSVHITGGNWGGTRVIYGSPEFRPQRNRWYKITYYQKIDSPKGSSNGILKVWVDDVLYINRNDVSYLAASKTDTSFYAFDYAPVWGGVANITKLHDDYLWIDGTIISTDPPGGILPENKIPRSPNMLKIE